jgi:hypothetical protein
VNDEKKFKNSHQILGQYWRLLVYRRRMIRRRLTWQRRRAMQEGRGLMRQNGCVNGDLIEFSVEYELESMLSNFFFLRHWRAA